MHMCVRLYGKWGGLTPHADIKRGIFPRYFLQGNIIIPPFLSEHAGTIHSTQKLQGELQESQVVGLDIMISHGSPGHTPGIGET